MKGVILAGGSGTRLMPNTKVTNKHLLPVYNQPMIYYPIQTLLKAGIEDILILPGKDHAGDFAKLLGSGKDFNARFTFKVQDHAGGLAYAVGLAEEYVGDDNFTVIFGDNILEDNIVKDVQEFKDGAKIFLKQVHDPERFGIAELDGTRIVNIEEKPKDPKSNWASIGVYIYDSKAFEYIKTLKPSARGELEITDLNNIYVRENKMRAGFVKGFWFDTGTHESLVEAAHALKTIGRPIDPLTLEMKNAPKVFVGGVLYDSANGKFKTSKYLPDFMKSLMAQDYANKEIIFLDNSPSDDNDNTRFLKENYPDINIIRSPSNLGYSKAYNRMIEIALRKGADYFLATNVDMVYEPNVISELVNSVMKTPQVASATGKVKRWDFSARQDENGGRTNFIDSAGICITKEHRFIDRGQGDIDHGQYDIEEYIFGASAATALYRLSALEDTAFIGADGRKEYFDELMFMYKEDIDLAYRLQWAGYKCVYNPAALSYHNRSLSGKGRGIIDTVRNRMGRSKKLKRWSWLNHHIMLKKMFDRHYSYEVKKRTLFYEFKSLVYAFLFEPFLLREWMSLFKMRKDIKRKKDQIKKRVNIKSHIEQLMID